jgi:hypothetical protein
LNPIPEEVVNPQESLKTGAKIPATQREGLFLGMSDYEGRGVCLMAYYGSNAYFLVGVPAPGAAGSTSGFTT